MRRKKSLEEHNFLSLVGLGSTSLEGSRWLVYKQINVISTLGSAQLGGGRVSEV